MGLGIRRRRARLLLGGGILGLMVTNGHAAEKVFDIPPEHLSDALRAFGMQSGESIAFSGSDTRETHSSGAVGRYETDDALMRILMGSDLTFVRSGGGYVIVPRSPPARVAPAALLVQTQGAAAGGSIDTALATRTEPRALEEVVVTARRQEESLLDVPISVSAVTSRLIQSANLKSIVDLQNYTPGLTFSEDGAGREDRATTNYVIRGLVSSSISTVAPLTTLFIDGAPVVSGEVAGLTDLARVEVLKGPQSVYFGRGTYAGAINLVTRTPSLTHWGGDVSLEGARYAAYDISGSVEGPIVRDKLAIRLSGRIQDSDGPYKNNTAEPGASQALGARSTKSLSTSIYAEPVEHFTARLYGTIAEFNDGSPASTRYQSNQMTCALGATGTTNNFICGHPPAFPLNLLGFNDATDAAFQAGIAPFSIFHHVFAEHGGTAVRLWSANLDLKYQFMNGWSLETLTAVNRERAQTVTDEDSRDTYNIPNPSATVANGFRPFYNYLFLIEQENRDISQDIRLNSSQNSWLRWTIGVNYIKLHNELAQSADTPLNPEYQFFSNSGDQGAETVSGYGAIYVDLPKHLTLSAEGRYQSDRVFNNPRGAGNSTPAGVSKFGTVYTSFSPRLTLSYKPTSDLNFYTLWARGFRPGGFNTNLATQPAYIVAQISAQTGGVGLTYDQEQLDDYEFGMKSRFLDGRLSTDIDAYYEKLQKQQTSLASTVTVNGTPPQPLILSVTANTGDADLYGVELETAFRATRALTLEANFADNITRQGLAFCSVCAILRGASNPYINGTQLPRAPQYTATLSVTYEHALFSAYSWYARADYRFESTKYATLLNLLSTGDRNIVNVRAGVRCANLSVEAYVTNLFDDRTPLALDQALDITPGHFSNTAVSVNLAQPRIYGARLRYNF